MKAALYLIGFLVALYLVYVAMAADFDGALRVILGILGLGLIIAFVKHVIHDKG
jgi:hypothetical protein